MDILDSPDAMSPEEVAAQCDDFANQLKLEEDTPDHDFDNM